MFDMLVKLYDLPDMGPAVQLAEDKGYVIRRAMSYERTIVLSWLQELHTEWVDECAAAFTQNPVACFIATKDGRIVGFANYDVVAKNMFGPTGVEECERGQGIGLALLLVCLQQMRSNSYAYAVIGGVGPQQFYEKAVGAVPIQGSTPGVYIDRLRKL
jgi:predicted N-acetyltransferase YhbS